MSGGSLNYIYCKDIEDLFSDSAVSDLESAEDILLKKKYIDAARDVRRLIEYIESARNCVDVLHAQLAPVLKAVEWYDSADIGADNLARTIEAYRRRDNTTGRTCATCKYLGCVDWCLNCHSDHSLWADPKGGEKNAPN